MENQVSYLSLFVVTASLILQVISAFVAVRLLRYGENRTPGLLMLLAAFLMAVRRSLSLYQVFSGGEIDLFAEIVGCLVSFVLLAGFLYFSRLITNLHREMNKRTDAEKNLTNTTAKLQALIYAIPDLVVFKDAQGRHLIVNKAAEDFIGLGQDELAGRTNEELLPPGVAASCRKGDEEAMRSPKPVRYEEHGAGKNGRGIFLDTIKVPIRDEEGNLQGLVAVSRDITERHQMEEALRKSEANYRSLLEQASDGIAVIDQQGRYLDVNSRMCDMMGYSREEFLTLTTTDLVAPEALSASPLRIPELLAGQTVLNERLMLRKDGSTFPMEISAKMIPDGRLCGIHRDVTERKAAEQALRVSEERLSKAQKTAHVGNWEKNCLTGHLYWSEEVYRIFGVDPANFTPASEAVRNAILPEDRDAFIALDEALKERKPFEMDLRVVRPDGDIRTIHVISELFLDHAGRPIIHSGTVQDITEQKAVEEELRSSHEQLEHLNRTLEQRVLEEIEKNRAREQMMQLQSRHAAMGEMIDNIAHQWRQPLNNLGLIMQGMQKRFNDGVLTPGKMQEQTKIGMSLIRYMSQTINDFTNFFRQDKEKVKFRVKDAVATALSFMETSLKRNAITVLFDGGDDVAIQGYRNEYTQVLINILNNARDIVVERGIQKPAITLSAFRENNASVLTIADNGGGISEEFINRIFAPYFTTKSQNKGTGIGLYMSKMIIENNMNGKLSVHNNGEGAQFRIEIQDLK